MSDEDEFGATPCPECGMPHPLGTRFSQYEELERLRKRSGAAVQLLQDLIPLEPPLTMQTGWFARRKAFLEAIENGDT